MASVSKLQGIGSKLAGSNIAVAGMGFVVGYQLMEAAWWPSGRVGWDIVVACVGAGIVVALVALKWRAKTIVRGAVVGIGSFFLLLNFAAGVVLTFGWATSVVGTGWQTASVVLALLVAVVLALLSSSGGRAAVRGGASQE